MRFVVLILVVALLSALATYAVLNLDERVDVTLPWTTLRGLPQIYLVLAALAAGAAFMGILSVIDGARLRLTNRRLRKQLERVEAALPGTPPVPAGEPGPAPETDTRRAPDSAARGPFRGGEPAERPQIPSGGSKGGDIDDDTPPYGM